MDIEAELNSTEFKVEWARHTQMTNDALSCVAFSVMNFRRDPKADANFFVQTADDLVQSIVSIRVLAREGIRNACRRELRYLIEMGIKSCYVSQQEAGEDYENQIKGYDRLLKSPNIGPVNDIKLYLLNMDGFAEQFLQETKRQYGLMSNYVHSTPTQLNERIELVKAERSIGFEGVEELKQLNGEVERVYASLLILLFHSIPVWVVGDFMVNGDGTSNDWYFAQSKYIAALDKTFDYKVERQRILDTVKTKREARIKF